MRRLAFVLALAAVAAFVPPAGAKVPCRDRIYNDWDRDGKIASTYPLSCYRDALRHIPVSEGVYTSLEDDIRAAMQAAIDRAHGKKVAAQVGAGVKHHSRSSRSQPGPMMDERTQPLVSERTRVSVSPADSGGGIPTPLLVLGGLALALVVSGGVGLVVRANRGAGPAA